MIVVSDTSAIVLAKESRADLLLIDEKLGRQMAVREGVSITGLMGILVEAKHRRLIGSVRGVVDQLENQAGFRVSEAVKLEIFLAAGE